MMEGVTEPVLSRILLDALRAVNRQVASTLVDRGAAELTPGQAAAILNVERTGTRLTDLAERAQVTKQAMMQMVDQLESRGFVRRTSDPADARAKIVRLTARGLRQRAEARRAVAGVESRAKRLLGDRRYESLRSALSDLASPAE
jgi:DNA-binding MarR family transcriptional regulator